MKQNIYPVTLFSIKEGPEQSTLLKAKWKVVGVKLAALLKRSFPFETFSSKFPRNYSSLRVASCEKLCYKASLSK